MSNLNISQLPQTTTVSGPELLPVMQGGVTKYTVANDIPLSTFNNTNMATTTQVASVSAGLSTRITLDRNDINTLFSTYANSTTVAAVSAGLNNKVNITNNSVNTLFSTYANSTTVAAISAGLNTQVASANNSVNTLFSTYANSTTVAAISAGLNTQVASANNSVNTLFSTYANSTTVAAISAGLNTQINTAPGTLQATFNGQGTVPIAGYSVPLEIPYDCTVVGWAVYADTVGSTSFDVWRVAKSGDTYTPYPPTISNTILTNSTTSIALTSASYVHSTNLTGFSSVTLSKGDIVWFVIGTSVSITVAQLSLEIVRR